MKNFLVRLIENYTDGYFCGIAFECEADNLQHAIEQAENAYPDWFVIEVLHSGE